MLSANYVPTSIRGLLAAGILILAAFLPDGSKGETPEQTGNIDVLAYVPLNIGDVYTYDDGARAEITRTVELDWLDNVAAYEKVWTVNPNPQMTDVRYYYIISGDSLFWASGHYTIDGFANFAGFDPPMLMGTANTTPGDTLTTVSKVHTADDIPGDPDTLFWNTHQWVVNRSDPVSVPYGTFEDCITMTFIEVEDGEKIESSKLILAKGIGIIQGNEAGVASDLAPVHSLVDYSSGLGDLIDVPAYMPLNVGDVFTYDDGARAEITRKVELDWLDNVAAYEKVWTVNPNPQMTDVRAYYIISGDSLFLASVHSTQDNVADHAQFDPPVLMGTANTTPGDTLTTVGVLYGVVESTGLPEVDSSIVQVAVHRSGPVSVPYGTFEDCITMTITLAFIYEEDKMELKNVILAKGIGIIQGAEMGIASDLAPVHSLVDCRSGGADLIDVLAYMPLNVGDVFTYDDGARAEITRTIELDWLDNVAAYEKVWTVNPNPETSDVRYYFIISGDSLFWASFHGTHDDVADYAKFDPPVLMGTANTTPGDTLTTEGIAHGVEEDTGLPEDDYLIFQVVVHRSGPVSVPYGTFEDCITMTFIVVEDGEKEEFMNLILAKDIGIIYGREEAIASDLAPVHSLSDFQQGVTPSGPKCDFNEDGRILINDVIAYLLYARDHPEDLEKLDWNGDGKYLINDAIVYLLKIMQGTCPDALVQLSGITDEIQAVKMEGLTGDDIEYIEKLMTRMDLTEEQEAAFRLALYGAAGAARLPEAFSLCQNVPNPFNPATTVIYSMPEGAAVHVSVKVYDLRGSLVRTLVDKVHEAGKHAVFWDGRDGSGRQVSSGVYLYRMQAGGFVQTKKMVLLK